MIILIKGIFVSKLSFVLFAVSLVASSAYGAYNQAPPNFSYKESQAVFVDFEKASYKITYDYQNKKAEVESSITFSSTHAGYPIFDLVPQPQNVMLDGQLTSAVEIADPDQQTKVRVVQSIVSAGTHTLTMKSVIDTNIVFNDLGVASGFWLGDLSDRKYLEQYIPSNLEYDQFQKDFLVNFIGFGELKHIIKTNGTIKNQEDGSFLIEFPAFYTSSSVFFHVFPEELNLMNVTFDYKSIDGRILPVDIYTSVEIDQFIPLTRTLLAELENDYGPFPHDKVLIYGNSLLKGGMEYSGATATGLLSLGHELFHSYNARGVMPANGNSGWMDEAMSRWRDNNYPLAKELTFESTQLAAHSVWQRNTDRMAYTEGSAFLSLIAYKMNEKGFNLKEVLNEYFKANMYQTVTTTTLEKKFFQETGMDFTADFNKYIYDKKPSGLKGKYVEDAHHPHMSAKELLDLTMPKRM